MRSHRILAAMAAIGLTASALTACGTSAPDAVDRDLASDDDPAVVRIGTTDSHQQAWSVFQDLAAQQGITLTIVHFSDYGEINDSLAQGGLDVNKFQHIMYLAEYNKKAGHKLEIVGSGEIFPLALFWKDHDRSTISRGRQFESRTIRQTSGEQSICWRRRVLSHFMKEPTTRPSPPWRILTQPRQKWK